MTGSYKNLIVWKKSIELVFAVYRLTNLFSEEEKFGLTSQMRRAVVSIPSNIAEVKLRQTDKQFNRFLLIAYGSGGELETQLEIAKGLPDTSNLDYTEVENLLSEVMKMLNKLIAKG